MKDKSIDELILRFVDAALLSLINAVAHRDWASSGQFIKVSMYDDRLEIESPGRFPNIVTADNISYTRLWKLWRQEDSKHA